MPAVTPDWASLEDKLNRLAAGHARLAELVEEQRRAICAADPTWLAAVGRRIEAELGTLGLAETARREACRQLAVQLGLDAAAGRGAPPRLAGLCQRAPEPWARRLRQAASQLADQLDRVRRVGRVNLGVARRLSDFCGELLGQVARIGRETGCYNAHGRRAVAREPIGTGCFSAVG